MAIEFTASFMAFWSAYTFSSAGGTTAQCNCLAIHKQQSLREITYFLEHIEVNMNCFKLAYMISDVPICRDGKGVVFF